MTANLNQAFIKAYSKESAARGKSELSDDTTAESAKLDDLVIRFDTASMEVPAPKSPVQPAKPVRRSPEVSAEQGGAAIQRSDAPKAPVPAPKLNVPSENRQAEAAYSDPPSDASLRQSIASRMLQAGEWQGQQVDAFWGAEAAGMTVAQPEESIEELSRESATRVLRARIEQPESLIAEKVQLPEADATAPAPTTEQVHTELVQTEQLPTEPITSATEQAATEQKSAPLVTPSVQAQLASQTTASAPQQIPDLEPPASPALASNSTTPARQLEQTETPAAEASTLQAATAVSQSAVTQSAVSQSPERTQSPAAKPDSGELPADTPTDSTAPTSGENPTEIFRLDKPSYYERAAILDGTDVETSVTESDSPELSELTAPATANSQPIVRTDAPAQDATAKADRREATSTTPTKQVDPIMAEAQLREATNRIFNPVWEVDNLHWPHICFDLLSRGGGQMDAVAENLVAACQEGLQVMAVTSPQGGEGRTTIACCLAILAGSRGLKVAIVDGDLDSPSLSFQTNLDVEQDWRTAIEHQLPLEEVAVHSIEDQVTVVPLLSPVGHEELSADDDRIAGMLSELSESFDLVIVDMGPMESPRSLVSTMGECGILSAVVTVVDQRQDTAEQLEACLRRIRQAGVVSVGLVENFAA